MPNILALVYLVSEENDFLSFIIIVYYRKIKDPSGVADNDPGATI